jgi:hypothetical protein
MSAPSNTIPITCSSTDSNEQAKAGPANRQTQAPGIETSKLLLRS